MILQDDRTPEQKLTHTVVIGGTDRFMSGWGAAQGGTSVAGWACRPEDAKTVWEWVESRQDMKRVRYLPARPKGAHVHVYVVTEDGKLWAIRQDKASIYWDEVKWSDGR